MLKLYFFIWLNAPTRSIKSAISSILLNNWGIRFNMYQFNPLLMIVLIYSALKISFAKRDKYISHSISRRRNWFWTSKQAHCVRSGKKNWNQKLWRRKILKSIEKLFVTWNQFLYLSPRRRYKFLAQLTWFLIIWIWDNYPKFLLHIRN